MSICRCLLCYCFVLCRLKVFFIRMRIIGLNTGIGFINLLFELASSASEFAILTGLLFTWTNFSVSHL